MSFAAADGADNRDGLAGGKQRHRGRFSIKASPSQRSSKWEAGQSQHWADKAGRVLCWAGWLASAISTDQVGRQGGREDWIVMGSEEAKSQKDRAGKMESPSPALCSIMAWDSACFYPTSLLLGT